MMIDIFIMMSSLDDQPRAPSDLLCETSEAAESWVAKVMEEIARLV